MEKKMTKIEMFSAIREVVSENAEMVAFIDHEIELISKKAASKTGAERKAQRNHL